jgi:hypothetical protein
MTEDQFNTLNKCISHRERFIEIGSGEDQCAWKMRLGITEHHYHSAAMRIYDLHKDLTLNGKSKGEALFKSGNRLLGSMLDNLKEYDNIKIVFP